MGIPPPGNVDMASGKRRAHSKMGGPTVRTTEPLDGRPYDRTSAASGGRRTSGTNKRAAGELFQIWRHWAAMCPVKGPRGRMQMVGHSQLWVSQKGVAFDMQGPPPSACKWCGENHWEQFYPAMQ